MVTRVNGGIITKQNLQGNLRYFKMTGTGAFQYTLGTDSGGSTPEVIIPNVTVNGVNQTVPIGHPVPNSVAERIFHLIMEKCTVGIINIVSDNEIHFAIENTTNAWDETMMVDGDGDGDLDGDTTHSDNAAANITAAIVALATVGSTETPVPNTTVTGATSVDVTGILVTEHPFVLA